MPILCHGDLPPKQPPSFLLLTDLCQLRWRSNGNFAPEGHYIISGVIELRLDIRHCPKNGQYYLQCIIEERSIDRKIEDLERSLSKAVPADREILRHRLEELRHRRRYMVDYIPLKEHELPVGVKVRRLPSAPTKIVSVDQETKRWLLTKFHVRDDFTPIPVKKNARCYDLPAEDDKDARP